MNEKLPAKNTTVLKKKYSCVEKDVQNCLKLRVFRGR